MILQAFSMNSIVPTRNLMLNKTRKTASRKLLMSIKIECATVRKLLMSIKIECATLRKTVLNQVKEKAVGPVELVEPVSPAELVVDEPAEPVPGSTPEVVPEVIEKKEKKQKKEKKRKLIR